MPRVVLSPGAATRQGPDGGSLGVAMVMEAVDGETLPRKVQASPSLTSARARFARQCGEILAAIHRIPTDAVPGLPGGDQLAHLRATVDHLGQPHPVFELAFGALSESRPPPRPDVVVHGDFRLGNLVVGPGGIEAVLDWELAHRGDPAEDLAWLCLRAWRFGGTLPVGGLGERDALLAAYESAGGTPVDPGTFRWWELLCTLRWGVVCIVQTATHLSGAHRSVELATIGRRVCEVEWDLLDLLDSSWAPTSAPDHAGDADTRAAPPPPPDTPSTHPAPALHDAPSAAELVEAVRDFLADEVMAATGGSVRYHARVAANALAIVGRQLAAGDAPLAAHRTALAALGCEDDAALAAAVRSGRLHWRDRRLWAVLRQSVAAKLDVANPSYRLATTPRPPPVS